jgi:tetratricopeptide (TPR) repeat protein
MTLKQFNRYTSDTIGLLFALLLFSSCDAVADVDELHSLLNSGENEAAYQHAVELARELEGNVDFDFLLGMAAVKSGRLPEAVFAFERILIVQPGNHRARLELARVYYLQQDYQNAKTEFSQVLAQQPPANVRARINAYLTDIDAKIRALSRSGSVFASVSVGYDSNINSSTSDDSVTVPALGAVQLSETSRELDDQFSELAAGGTVEYLTSQRSSWAAMMNINNRNNFSSDNFDTTTANVMFAYTLKQSRQQWRFPFQFQQLNVDGSGFRRMGSVGGEYSRPAGNGVVSLDGKLGSLRFPDYQIRDADFATAAANWRVRLQGGQSMVSSGINIGYEDPEYRAGDHFGRRYSGVQFSWQRLRNNNSLFANAFYQHVEHTAQDGVFLKTRKDQLFQLAVGHTWRASRNWRFTTSLQGLANDSNITLYDYDRILIKGGLSYVY